MPQRFAGVSAGDRLDQVIYEINLVEDSLTSVEDSLASVEDSLSSVEDSLSSVEDSLGWKIPVREMSFWVRGLPVPELVYEIAYDDQGLPDWLEQSGWRVEYQKYKQRRPVRAIFFRDSIHILLVVKEWHLDEP